MSYIILGHNNWLYFISLKTIYIVKLLIGVYDNR